MKKKVFVGLSGGVDSSVSALLLKQAGYDVTGVFIRGWQPDWIPCTWKADRISAMRTAAHLDISFLTLDLENQYKNKVVKYLLDEYSKGNTPNPDMLCNREIKFGDFLRWSIKSGADFIATGHYAQIVDGEFMESVDKEKDQTYFLSQLTQQELQHVLFPIGHLHKKQVRDIATKYNLPVATRKDSQGICFVGELEMSDFLKRELKPEPGNVLNLAGEVIGTHEGAILYTIGQRHGFKIHNASDDQKNVYVVSKDVHKNILVVDSKVKLVVKKNKDEEVVDRTIQIKNFSFASNLEDIRNANSMSMRVRYRGDKYKIEFVNFLQDEKVLLVKLLSDINVQYDHGQFAVIYDGEKCLGGGEL